MQHREPVVRGGEGSLTDPAILTCVEIRRRRRDVFVTLLGAVAVTLLLAIALGGSIWMLQIAVDVVFVAYVALLVSLQQQTIEKDQKVRYMPPAQARRQPQPQLAVRRYGS